MKSCSCDYTLDESFCAIIVIIIVKELRELNYLSTNIQQVESNQLFSLKHSSVEDLLQCVGVNDMYYSKIPIKPTPYFLFSLVSVKDIEQETDIMHPHYNKPFFQSLSNSAY